MSNLCKTCHRPKAQFDCGLCHEHICKSCTQFMVEGAFSFLPVIPKDLKHSSYCSACFDEHVAAPLHDYEETMAKAKEVMIFYKAQTKLTGHLKRKEEPVTVVDCEDEEETVLRLGFLAAKKGFNCILDILISHRKIIVGSHKKTVFSGTAIPITIDPKVVREY